MKHIALGLAAVLASVAAAHADPFAVAYGNTVTQTVDGHKTLIYVNADKTWEQHMEGGMVMKGTYEWKDAGHVCFTEVDPAPKDPAQATSCSEIKGDHKVGDTWTETTQDGKTVTMAISAGR